jgi:hypothetical protein
MKTIKITTLFLFCLMLFGLNSCIEDIFIEGNGISRTESRSVSRFDQITSGGDFLVTVMPGTHYSVEVTADSNLLPYIETDVVGNTLKIRTQGLYSLRSHDPIEIYITTPVLSGVTLSGSGLIETGSFSGPDFRITLSGSGDIDTQISADRVKASVSGSGTIYIAGDALETEFAISGSGKIKSYDLEQNDCQATISGSGDMFVNAYETIDARISGSGKVNYINYPVIHTSISGSGKVVDRN